MTTATYTFVVITISSAEGINVTWSGNVIGIPSTVYHYALEEAKRDPKLVLCDLDRVWVSFYHTEVVAPAKKPRVTKPKATATDTAESKEEVGKTKRATLTVSKKTTK